MADEKLNLADIMETLKDCSFTQEELEAIRSLMERLREYGVGRKEYRLPSPATRRRIRIGKAEEPDPRTIKLTTTHR